MLCLAILGVFWRSLVFLCVVHFNLPIPVLIAADSMAGLSGGNALLLATGAAYISDITSIKSRTFRIIVLETCDFVGVGVGQIILGAALHASPDQSLAKYMLPLYICIGCTAASLLYVAVPEILLETVDRRTTEKPDGLSTVLVGILDLVRV